MKRWDAASFPHPTSKGKSGVMRGWSNTNATICGYPSFLSLLFVCHTLLRPRPMSTTLRQASIVTNRTLLGVIDCREDLWLHSLIPDFCLFAQHVVALFFFQPLWTHPTRDAISIS